MVLDQLDIHMQKMDLGTDCMPFAKFNSKWIIDLNAEHKIIKLEGRENLHAHGCVDTTPKRICAANNLDFIKMKSSALQKTMKKQDADWKKLFAKKAHQIKDCYAKHTKDF